MDYQSGTATTPPFAAGSPPPLPPNNAEQIGKLVTATLEELGNIPVTPATASRHEYLRNMGAQLQQRLGVVWDNPPAWEGVHRQALEFRQAVNSLRGAPFRTGQMGTYEPSTLEGLFGFGSTDPATLPARGRLQLKPFLVWGVIIGGVVLSGYAIYKVTRPGRGGVGNNPHGLKLNLKNPKFPNARKAR